MTWKQALLKSIEKWDRICFGDGRHSWCALCSKAGSITNCRSNRCPVAIVADADSCDNTPFRDYKRGRNIQEYLFLCMLYHEYYGDA